MTKPSPEQTAKMLAKITGMPLPRVAQLMQKFPIDTAPAKLADEIDKTLKAEAQQRSAARIAEARSKIEKEELARYKNTKDVLAKSFPFMK